MKKKRLVNSTVKHNADQYQQWQVHTTNIIKKQTKERFFCTKKIVITCHYSHEIEEKENAQVTVDWIDQKEKKQTTDQRKIMRTINNIHHSMMVFVCLIVEMDLVVEFEQFLWPLNYPKISKLKGHLTILV